MSLNDLLMLEYGLSINILDSIKINKFCLNSKEIVPGDVFVAVNSGYKYIDEAILNGSVAVIISNDIDYHNDNILVIKTSNMNLLLKKIASYIININKTIKIAITGSNGKTTTKELIYYGLETKYKVLKSNGNYNNFLGLIDTLFRLDNHDYLIMEFGMNHKGEISELSNILKPDIGVITNIGSAHIGNLGSKKNIFKAKMEIVSGNPKMILYVNGYDKFLKKVDGLKVKNCMYNPLFDHLKIDYNLAWAVLKHFSFSDNKIIECFNNYQMYKQRMNIIYKGSTIIIDDTYNASEESTIGGLKFLTRYQQDKIIILGDILESGKYAKKIHKRINRFLHKMNNTLVLHIGDYTKYIKGIHFNCKNDLINYLMTINLKNKVIYLKGSRMMNLEVIRDNLLLKF